jgi:hypothetical protein
MPGVPRELAEHALNVRPDAKPVKQPLRRFAEEKRKAIGEEIARLLAAGFIMEVFYPDWLANPVLVLKKNNTWRMCIDYTSLNKACPKDPFALPRIDQEQIGRNVHAYVDDVVVKTKQGGTLLDDLKETFTNLRRYRMKLTPEKCTFGVPAGQLLGYIVSQRGIEANPSKIKAIEALEKPTQLRDVQKFAGCLASLSRFVSRLGEKAMPLYQLMKKTDHFVWSQRANDAFNDLK